jgi:DNA-binding MarR family transcriptional regulator
MSHKSDAEHVLAFAFEVRLLVTRLNAALTTLFRPLGISCVQAEALLALAALGSATLAELSAHLVAESGHPSRLVSRLVAQGFIARTASPVDQRAVALTLTPTGRDIATRAEAARAPLVAEFAQRHGARLTDALDLIRLLNHELAAR